MESRWAVNPKVRRGDHTFLMVSDFLTNPGFPADSCSVWVASGRMLGDIIVSHRWITEFTGNGSNGEMVCFRAARNKVDCRWETMFSLLELQNALRGLRQAAGLMGLSEAWDWERRARHEEAGELKLYKQICLGA